jgi:hypothetical protein
MQSLTTLFDPSSTVHKFYPTTCPDWWIQANAVCNSCFVLALGESYSGGIAQAARCFPNEVLTVMALLSANAVVLDDGLAEGIAHLID